ncbi:hypothetical protein MRX96_048581 [Rhipicephalus microplus]
MLKSTPNCPTVGSDYYIVLTVEAKHGRSCSKFVLPSYQRPLLFLPALPALVRMCQAFPPLAEDVAVLLLQLGRVCLSQECTTAPPQLGFSANQLEKSAANVDEKEALEGRVPSNSVLCGAIQKSFADLCDNAVLNRTIY